jgi:predicted ribosomally synthesized peptide with SipW-like signal peptide
MINRKIAMSGLSILASLSLMAGATYAFFSDTATSSNNLFQSGTMSLQVRDDSENFTDTVTASWVTPTDWLPGETYQNYLCFKNDGSTDIQDIYFAITQGTETGSTNFKDFINASFVELGSATDAECQQVTGGTLTDFTPLVVSRFDANTDTKVTLAELFTDVTGADVNEDDLLDGVGNFLPPGGIVKFRVTWQFDPTATETVAGASVIANMAFKGTQVEDQTP